jgi:hypothetical protein
MAQKEKNTENAILNRMISEKRNQIRGKVQKDIYQDLNKYKRKNRFLWEGVWLKRGQIIKCQKQMKKRDRVVFIEILMIFFIIGIFSFFLLILTMALLPS